MGFQIKGKHITNRNLHSALTKLMTASHYKDHKHAYKVNRLVSMVDKVIGSYGDELKSEFEKASKEFGVEPGSNVRVSPELEAKLKEIRAELEEKEYTIEWHILDGDDVGPVKFSPAEIGALEPVLDPSYFSELTSE